MNSSRYRANKDGRNPKSYLEVRVSISSEKHGLHFIDDWKLLCTVSIIDKDGKSRCPKTFEMDPFDKGVSQSEFWPRSYILDNADEFLPEDILTICCEFSLDIGVFSKKVATYAIEDFLFSIPQSHCCRKEAEMQHLCNSFKVYDLTHKMFTLPENHEARNKFGFHSIFTQLLASDSESEEDSNNLFEDVWTFDTRTARFLLIFNDQQDSLGHRLLKASPVIERMVNTPMTERHEKRIRFPVFDRIFGIILYILDKGMFSFCEDSDWMDVYKFCHTYEMKEWQQKSAEVLVASF